MPDYAVGASRHTPAKGPVLLAYVDTDALECRCPNCGAQPGDFCRHPAELGGGERRAPCPRRIIAAHRAHQPPQEAQ